MVKNPPAMWETCVPSLGWEDPLEEGMATHSSVLAWSIPMEREAWQATVHECKKFICLFVYCSFKCLEEWLAHSRSSISICWMSEWMNTWCTHISNMLELQVRGYFSSFTWDVCSINSSRVSENHPCLPAPARFLLETRNRKIQVTQDSHHHYYNLTLRSSPATPPSLPLWIKCADYFPQTSYWEKKSPLSELRELADERREIKSIFKAVLWFACRIGSALLMSLSDVQPKHLCSLREKSVVPQNQYRNNWHFLQTLDFHPSEEKTGNRKDGEFSEESWLSATQ